VRCEGGENLPKYNLLEAMKEQKRTDPKLTDKKQKIMEAAISCLQRKDMAIRRQAKSQKRPALQKGRFFGTSARKTICSFR